VKLIDYTWDHPSLSQFRKTLPEGAYLFRQGELGDTMFIIVQGLVELLARRDDEEYPIAVLGAGQFLGEKALIGESTHQRVFTARTLSEITFAELSLKNFETLSLSSPKLTTDLLKQMFQIAAKRLEETNGLVRSLFSSDREERFLRLLLHFCATTGESTEFGVEVVLKRETLCYYCDMTKSEIGEGLFKLVKSGRLIKTAEDSYVVREPSKLLEFIPELSKPNISAL